MAIAYVSIGALDVEASLPFFDATFGAAGLERSFHDGGWAGYGEKGKDADLYICTPFDGQPARAGNGAMIALKVASQDQVAAVHATALANGGSDEGAPGFRPADSTNFYGAYFRDPTGNKFCVFTRP